MHRYRGGGGGGGGGGGENTEWLKFKHVTCERDLLGHLRAYNDRE